MWSLGLRRQGGNYIIHCCGHQAEIMTDIVLSFVLEKCPKPKCFESCFAGYASWWAWALTMYNASCQDVSCGQAGMLES